MDDQHRSGSARTGASKNQWDQSHIHLLLHQLALSFDRRSWHGPNLLGSLRGVTLSAVTWRPQPSRHNIWEEVVHCAYWKYRVCRLLTPDDPPSFSLKGSDWFPRTESATSDVWEQDLALLREWHGRLLWAVQLIQPDRLDDRPGRSEFTFLELISGAAAHDLYHAGQIRLLRRMHDEAEPEAGT